MRNTPEYMAALDYRLDRIVNMCEKSLANPDDYPVFAAPLSKKDPIANITEVYGLGEVPPEAIQNGVSASLLVAMSIARSEPVRNIDSDEILERRALKEAGEDAAIGIRQVAHLSRMKRRGTGAFRGRLPEMPSVGGDK